MTIIKKLVEAICIISILAAVGYGGYTMIQAIMEKGAASITSPKTIEELAGLNFDDIDHITTTRPNKPLDPSEFKSRFRQNLYESSSDELNYKKDEIYRCYDSENNLLLTLTDYPKDSAIELDIDGEISLYKKYTPPTESATTLLTK